jgi:16S rRNA C1402 N4-methylase RsmH
MSAPQLRQIGLRINPATRTFQALRIFLNQELEQLDTLLRARPPSCWQSAAASP